MQGSPIAVKTIRVESRGKPLDIIMREIETLRKRRHRHIVEFLASYTEKKDSSGYEYFDLNILFPWANMDMDEWMMMKRPPSWLAEQSRDEQRKHLYTVLYDLISALAYLHKEIDGKSTSHHDLKPHNVLVYPEKLVIADLEYSHLRSIDAGSESEGKWGLGTYAYMPPECWTGDGANAGGSHGRGFDMWAMGCIMIEVAVLIVNGWESEKVGQFREARSHNPTEKRRFEQQYHNGTKDNSFHNNMAVVDRWHKNLQGDGSSQLTKTLSLTSKMLKRFPNQRLSSWEAKLDMYEILHPDASQEDRRKQCDETVPRPPKKKLDKVSTPLHRAAENGDLTRIKVLLQRGWPADIKDGAGNYPVQLARRFGPHESISLLSQSENRKLPISQRLYQKAFQPGQPHYDSWEEDLRVYVKENDLQKAERLLLSSHPMDIDYLHQRLGPKDISVNYLHENYFYPDDYSASALHLALSNENTAMAKLLLRKGADPNRKNHFGVTPLHMAALRKKIEFVELFLEHHAKIDITDNFGQTPLFCAAFSGKTAIIELLLQRKADVNATDKEGMSLLHQAVHYSKKNLVTTLLKANADIDAKTLRGNTALHIAILHDQTAGLTIVSQLFAKGANPYLKNQNGISPLHDALHHGKIKCVQLLLQSAASMEITNENEEIVLFGAKSESMLAELVNAGANINAKDIQGRTVLHLAAADGDLDLVRLLLRYGAHVHARSHDELTAMDEANNHGHTVAYELLSSHTSGQIE